MVRSTALAAAAAALMLNTHANAESLYPKSSKVIQLSGIDYDRVIAKSNYTSIVEFYAPWCGHCKNLKPAYETAAKSLEGIAKVAAVNCDDEMNKPFCGQMGVQGFPTLKIVRPGKKPGKPTVEDYQGQRNAKAIVEAVKDKIPNNVKRVTDKNLDEWLGQNKETAKAILFSDKGLVSATLRTLAVDFLGLVSVAQIRNKEAGAVEKYGIDKFPTLVLLKPDSDDVIKYDGEMKKDALVAFLSQVSPPNPDCPPPKAKKSKKKTDKKDDKKESKFSKASSSHKSAEASSAAASAQSETVQESVKPSESPDPSVKDEGTPEPVVIPEAEPPTIPILAESADLQKACLNDKSKTCILALLPDSESESSTSVITSLASIHKKHDASGGHLFPFIGVPASNPLAASVVAELSLGSDEQVHLIATNGKRNWFKKYTGTAFTSTEVESFIDAIRMGEGKKEKLPESLIATSEQEEVKQEKPVEQEPIQIQVEEILEDAETPEHNEL
ncbi:thioredoxin-domain-containing protein [Corynespora cassiicola Philippines]|uniref:protein disulfide-isomerase n=1 Tax=Corynespora cassiicola Philippines TaxID=1448308 RepID=A0A2T2NVW6_CORCC|nr:thioredoxin-domain-containing protein [Corynespora cassiicola Philippines]